tara:strand:- start:41526 stop:50405 length:8880 start_codon:yes stop_codon:yes gene_type:complete
MSKRPQLQNTSKIDTELPVKGMTKDPNVSLVGKDAWTHCRNCINNSQKGDVGSIGNEPANFQCACTHYPIIGMIHLFGDKWILFSTDDTNSEIGLFDDSRCEYTPLVNDLCLKFNKRYLITGASKENFDCSWQIYWDDGLNPSRTLNLGFGDSIPDNRNIPWVQVITSPVDASGNPTSNCVIYADAQPLRLDCERIRLAPLIDIPCMDLQKSKKGGQLRNGSYQAYIAYTVNEQKIGDYVAFSNIQPLFDHEDGSSALTLEISNLDTQFEFFELVIASNNQGQMQAKKLGFYSTENTRIEISYIDQKLQTIPIEFLPLRTPAYEKSDKMYVVNDYLIRQGPTTQFDFNYQPFANEINCNWLSLRYPADYYANGGNKTTFMRDEQYAFFIRFVYTTGEKSQSYHIPGRPPMSATFGTPNNPQWGDEMTLGDVNNAVNPGDLQWQVENTAFQNDLLPGRYAVGNSLFDGGVVVGKGTMGYWESTERYPATQPNIWNSPNGINLCGERIRHHKMPDEQTCAVTHRSTADAQSIYLLSVEFTNVVWPQDNQGNLIPNIAGFEILVGSREGHKSIIAKGIMRNMFEYTVPGGSFTETDSDGQGSITGIFPNYPFNDLGTDPFLVQEDYDTTRGRDTGNGLSNYRSDIFTFHSPETSFNRPFLNPRYVQSYGVTSGNSAGRFYASEDHPGHKLLRDIGAILAALIGIGYALGEMRGKKIRTQSSGGSLSIGQNIGPYAEREGKDDYGTTTNPGLNTTPTGSLTEVWTAPGGVGQVTTAYPGWPMYTEGTSGEVDTTEDDVAVAEVDYDGTDVLGGGDAPSQEDHAMDNADGNVDAHEDSAQGAGGAQNQQGGDPTGTGTYTADPGVINAGPTNILDNPLLPGSNNMGDNPEQAMNNTNFPFSMGGLTRTSGEAEANYYQSMNDAHNEAKKHTPGHIGPSETITQEGSKVKSMPNLIQLFSKMYTFLNYVATGGNEIIDLIYNLSSVKQYGMKYSSHGLYLNTEGRGGNWKSTIDKARYVGDSFQNLDSQFKINNLHRPKTVAIQTDSNITDAWGDDSKFALSTPGGLNFTSGDSYRTDQFSNSVLRNISAHYVGLKMDFSNQYGQLDGIRQIPAPACYIDFEKDLIGRGLVDNNGVLQVDQATTFNSRMCFGGDVYLARYTEKVIMPFWWEFLQGQPDEFPYDYRLRVNVPYPRYWANFEKYDLSAFISPLTNMQFNQLYNGIPSRYHNLDNPTGVTENSIDFTGGANNTSTGDTNFYRPSLFIVGGQFFYTHVSGVQDFFVESEINTALRDYEDQRGKQHYDWLEYTDLKDLFHADIIRDGNFYKYDLSLSKNKFFSALISFGTIQPRDYDPEVAERCYQYYPKRLIYSNRAEKEAKQDFWKVFLPNNYKDFKNKVNVIKPTSKSGALVLFPHLAPQLFQGVDQLTTDLKTKLTIGDGGLFSSSPMQNITNADLPHEYGSCESARSVVNTPSGLFYISQAQGKVFTYTGQGISNIANYGMKHWFNKYLPSVLLHKFPEIEGTVDADNPVVGVGCQSVYDPNYDLVYFCKKDYDPIGPCIEYNPELGFVYNSTLCDGEAQEMRCPTGFEEIDGQCVRVTTYPQISTEVPSYSYTAVTEEVPQYSDPMCPTGFTYNAESGLCEQTTTETFTDEYDIETVVVNPGDPTCDLDVVFVVDASSSVWMNGNASRMKNFVTNYLSINETAINEGKVKVGFLSFSFFAHMGPQGCTFPSGDCDCMKEDQFNGPMTLNSDFGNWGSSTGMQGWIKNYYRAMGKDNADENHCPCLHCTNNTTPPETIYGIFDANGNQYDWEYVSGTDNIFNWGNCSAYEDGWNGGNTDQYAGRCTNLIDGLWHGLNMLYADGSRDGVDKRLILLYDGVQNLVPFNWGGANSAFLYTGDRTAGTFADNVDGNWYSSNPTTPTYAFQDGPRDADFYYTNSNPNTGVENYDGTLAGGAAVTGNYIYMSPNWIDNDPNAGMAGGAGSYTAFGPGGYDVWDQGFMQPSGQVMGFAASSGWFDWWTTNVTQNPQYVDSTNSAFRGRLQVVPIFMWNNSAGLSSISESTMAGITAYGRNLAGQAVDPDTNQLAVDGNGDPIWNYHTHLDFFSNAEVEAISTEVALNTGCQGPTETTVTETITESYDTTNIITQLPEIITTYITQVIPDTFTTETTYETIVEPCPMNCDTVVEDGITMCRCTETMNMISLDSLVPIDLEDTEYFKDISWTVSYDPKAQAFISFHDWHPELTMPSLNHFFTTKTIEDRTQEPYCPPGFSYDADTDECCQNFEGDFEGTQIVDEFNADLDPEVPVESQPCLLDIVVSIDVTGSTSGAIFNAQLVFLNAFVDQFEDDMLAGYVQIGIGHWASDSEKVWVRTPHTSRTDNLDPNLPTANLDLINANNPLPPAVTFGGLDEGYNIYGQHDTLVVPDANGVSGSITNTRYNIGMSNNPWWNEGNWSANIFYDGGGTVTYYGMAIAKSILRVPGNSSLGDRSSLPGYKQIVVLVSDGENCVTGNLCSNDAVALNSFNLAMQMWDPDSAFDPTADGSGAPYALDSTLMQGQHQLTGSGTPGITVPCDIHAVYMSNTDNGEPVDQECGAPSAVGFDAVTCWQDDKIWLMGYDNLQNVANNIANASCDPVPLPRTCSCPDNYVMVWPDNNGNYTLSTDPDPTTDCRPDEVMCRRIDCDCDESLVPGASEEAQITFWEAGDCNDLYQVGDPSYVNSNPLWCYYNGELCTPASYTCGGIWKHNARCDLFADYYKVAYPWEIEFVSSKGQSVEILRSVEYQLEVYKYLYDPNIDTPFSDTGLPSDTRCEDRYHVKNYNFNEAVIHNSEQISGLLNLNLESINTLTTLPALNNAIPAFEIAYSKVEQKYRFNQFWDITDNRNIVRSQWITDMDGYDRELNLNNLNYEKINEEHKKFRHYAHKILLRRSPVLDYIEMVDQEIVEHFIPEDKKMILKLANSKLNTSFR